MSRTNDDGFSPGIQQGITIGLLARTTGKGPCVVRYRDDLDQAKADDRRAALLDSLNDPGFDGHYATAEPTPENFYAFRPWKTVGSYASWPTLVDLALQEPFSGLSEKRRGALSSHGRCR
jgi:hypothetical protein